MKHLALLSTLLWALFSQGVLAQQALVFGIYAYRPEGEMKKYSEELANLLKEKLPNYHFELKILSIPEIEVAVDRNELDFLITNPMHYIQLRSKNPLTSVLATKVRWQNGHKVSSLGGVIIRSKDRADIQSLNDLKGKKVAWLGSEYLGGFVAHVSTLRAAGISLDGLEFIKVNAPHDNVVNAVLKGAYDIGFIRTGVLEDMVREDRLKPGDIQVVNPQNYPGFPFKISTQLYPEWPVIAMSRVNPDIANVVAATLLNFQSDKEESITFDTPRFSVSADYNLIDRELRALRLPPYDYTPEFNLNDVLDRYQIPVVVVSFLVGLVLFLVALLWLKNCEMRRVNAELQSQHNRLDTIINSISDLIWLKDMQGGFLACNKHFEELYGATEAELLGKTDFDFVDQSSAEFFRRKDLIALDSNKASVNEEWVKFASDGRKVILETTKVPMRDGSGNVIGVLGVGHDITERKAYESALQLSASVFNNTQEGIMITDLNGNIVDINPGFSRITGYSKEDVVGRNASLLHSEKQGKDFYEQFWKALKEDGQWSGEIWNRTQSGALVAEYLSINSLRNAYGDLEHYLGVFSDVTFAKYHEAELQALANFDRLTGLPNRRLLDDRLSQAIAQSKRSDEMFAVAFLDLDGFKPVNDTYGHRAGDIVLVTVAERIQAALREEDTIARLGGDEFVILLRHLDSKQLCTQIIERVLQDIHMPIDIGEMAIQVSASAGIAIYPEHGTDASVLLKCADETMYLAKSEVARDYKFCDLKAAQ